MFSTVIVNAVQATKAHTELNHPYNPTLWSYAFFLFEVKYCFEADFIKIIIFYGLEPTRQPLNINLQLEVWCSIQLSQGA